MPTKRVISEIQEFLSGVSPQVVCVAGEWGAGKTYIWNRVLLESRNNKKIGLANYGYVSLFGVNSLESLKLALFENSAANTPEQEGRGVLSWEYAKRVLRKNHDFALALPWAGAVAKQLGPLYFSLVKEQIICIDDVERRGSGLTLQEVLGLVTFLKEERKCRVAILLNSNELGEDDLKEFRRQLEKVVDIELVVKPTPEEAAAIVFEGKDKVSDLLRANATLLGICNLRVLGKIERIVRLAVEPLHTFHLKVTEQVVSSVVLFAWVKFEPKIAPTNWVRSALHSARTPSDDFETGFDEDYKSTPEEIAEAELIRRYHWDFIDEMDLLLATQVDDGYFHHPELLKAAQAVQKTIETSEGQQTVKEAWDLAFDSFGDNKTEVVAQVLGVMQRTSQFASLTQLNQSINLLEALGMHEEMKSLIAIYKKTRAEDEEFWSDRDMWQEKLSHHLVEAIKERIASAPPISPAEALFQIGDDQKLTSETSASLALLTVDDLVTVFQSESGTRLSKIVTGALFGSRISNASADQSILAKRAGEALNLIAKTSNLNAWRVARYR